MNPTFCKRIDDLKFQRCGVQYHSICLDVIINHNSILLESMFLKFWFEKKVRKDLWTWWSQTQHDPIVHRIVTDWLYSSISWSRTNLLSYLVGMVVFINTHGPTNRHANGHRYFKKVFLQTSWRLSLYNVLQISQSRSLCYSTAIMWYICSLTVWINVRQNIFNNYRANKSENSFSTASLVSDLINDFLSINFNDTIVSLPTGARQSRTKKQKILCIEIYFISRKYLLDNWLIY